MLIMWESEHYLYCKRENNLFSLTFSSFGSFFSFLTFYATHVVGVLVITTAYSQWNYNLLFTVEFAMELLIYESLFIKWTPRFLCNSFQVLLIVTVLSLSNLQHLYKPIPVGLLSLHTPYITSWYFVCAPVPGMLPTHISAYEHWCTNFCMGIYCHFSSAYTC